ncbi:MAG TPA: carboxypeptidase-like regulatory domain-containing protein [Myxococcaceae bacterium]|jgi:hypothetical protein
MRRPSLVLTSALLLSCATTGGAPKEAPVAPQPISGKVLATGTPLAKVRVVVLKHRLPLGAESPCACEDHPTHALASCPAPESTEKLAGLAKVEPEANQVTQITTGADGTFVTPPLNEGHYDLAAATPGAVGWKTGVAAGAKDVEVPLLATAPITGQVRGPGGAPAGGAEVIVSLADARDLRGVVADSTGSFEIPGIPLGPNLVVASSKGLTPAKASPAPAATREGALTFAPLAFQLRPRVTLRGTVTRGGAPVVGADVLAPSECRTYRTKTGTGGAFELADLPARDYPVSAISGADGAQVLASLDAPGPLALQLQRGGVLAGKVKDKKGPLAGAEVVAVPRQPRGAGDIRRARTHQDGSFELGPMPPGRWQVEVAAAGHLARPPAEIRITAGARQPLEVELAPATHIAGFVVNDLADGLAGAEVEAVRSDANPTCTGCRLATRTSPDGSFVLYPLAQGEYTVRARHDRYLALESKKIVPTDNLRLALKPGASLLGTVRDPDQKSAIHASTSLRDANGTVVRPARPVDPNGTFRLEGLPAGAYTAVAESADPLPRRAEAAVTIAEGDSASADLELPPGMTLAGRVVDNAGKPVPGAEVQVAPASGHGMAIVPAGQDGAFEVKGLPPGAGKYQVSASRDGYLSGPKSRVPAEAGSRKVSLALSRLPAVKGRVRGIAAAEVWVNGQRRTLDDQRRFRAPLLRTGKQVVVVEAAGFAPAAASVDAPSGRDVDLGDLSFSAGRTLEGKVFDPDGKPLARAAVLAVDPTARDALRDRLYGAPDDLPPLAATLTGADGAYRVDHAPLGPAAVLIRYPLYLPMENLVQPNVPGLFATLQAGGTVVGKVVDEGGDPVRGTVTLVPAAAGGMVLAGTVGEAGRFGFGGLAPGPYTLAVSALPGADGSLMVFDPQPVEVKARETSQLELRPRAAGARVTVNLQLPEALGAISARLLPPDAMEAPAQSLYRRLFLAMPAEPSLARAPAFGHAPPGPQTLVLMRELGSDQIGLDRRRIDVPASGELAVTVDQLTLETVLRDEGR